MRPLTGAAFGSCAFPGHTEVSISDPTEAARPMSEPQPCPGLVPRPVPPVTGGDDDEEPPSPPRRHPLWQHIPHRLLGDRRWPSPNAVRSLPQLPAPLSLTPASLAAIGALPRH